MLRSCKSRSKLLAITVQYLRVESFLYSEIFDYLYVNLVFSSAVNAAIETETNHENTPIDHEPATKAAK